MYADTNIIKVKHDVLYSVAKHAFDGDLDEVRDNIPYEIIPGPLPQFRCCIYKEREIIRQRIRLAEGKAPGPVDDGNVIQVISSACEDCPISSYTVTDNCQNCIGKACMNACKFGAISIGNGRTHIDPNKCKECGMCAKSCPFGAIAHLKRPCKFSCPVGAIHYNEYGISQIDEEKCIRCGQCIHKCPFGAIGSKTWIVDIVEALKSDKEVYAIMAPASEGQFGEGITMQSFREALKKVGFKDLIEAGLGGDLTTMAEGDEWYEAFKNGEKKTTSCCPGFVNMIRKHYSSLAENISTTISPMCAVSRLVRAMHPGAVCVFIGPCVAKKSEIVDQKIEGNADYVLTYSEMRAIFKAKGVEVEPKANTYQAATVYGKRYGDAGGVTAAVIEYMDEMGRKDFIENAKVAKVNGAADCKKALLLMKAGKLPENFIEGMCCEGGCVGGPSRFKEINESKAKRDALLAQADDRTILDNLKNYPLDEFSMHREEHK